ncbi:mucin-associated surface protein [Trypanosoma cruzi cruzi]|uniref:Mucin-associated surface protein (MASP) n=1 Tax=Trypanosoma cruzi TaxID=5693 RepID=A0A2V2VXB8_TRYCR|nr:mucin-associated surface protein [Trypanosoma cruzi cruzi]PBJ76014.1 mucin-associated surface protein [Trypanosoma cruzi cruzi]PWU99878.1 Mucin-associated surface protein (MASP) [Trypanosoma cruzi]PWU99880.1 Mucin-associated surface protein (MASP) [Trypanosoma cruzi]
MMTGRVLLVCALCVLWCGVVVPAAYGLVSDRSVVEEDMVLTWYPVAEKDCEKKNTKEGMLDALGFKICMHESMKEICGNGDDETLSESRGPKAEEICKKYTGDPNKAVDSSTQLPEASPDAEKQVAAATPETPKDGAAEMGSPAGAPAGDSPAHPTEGPESASAATDTSNNEAQKGGAVAMPRNAPESDATGREEGEEGEEGEVKHSNTKETPAKTETMKDVTTTGDSDSSTAVSHTTSPLLLLVVACAAAVVAA